MAKQTPFNRIKPTERERLLMDYAIHFRMAKTYRIRASFNMKNGMDADYEVKWARQDAARCRELWKEIQAL